MKDNLVITQVQANHVYNIVDEILSNLPDKALQELLGGYNNDIEELFRELEQQVIVTMNFPKKLDTERLEYLDAFTKHIDLELRKLSYNYFKTVVLPKFRQEWRNIEWGNLVQLYPWSGYICQRGSGKSFEFTYAWPLWRLYSYDTPKPYTRESIDNANRKETCIITAESKLARLHLAKINEEIKTNDILQEKLNPNGKATLAAESISTETGSLIHLRTKGSFIRGLHVGGTAVDDFLDESDMYSKEQRDKTHETFYAEIKNIVEPGGFLLVSGTPFHERDLYYDLKNDPMFVVFEYPGVMPDGRLLAPDRFTYDLLKEKKKADGSLVFAREILVSPISDDTSIFPWDFLKRAFIGMENYRIVQNIDSYPMKLSRVVIGCDFATSGAIGADYTVYTIWGKDSQGNYYLLYMWRKRGASHNEQIEQIVALNQRFKPNKIICEANGFQGILADLARQRGIRNIEEFTTTAGNKKDLYLGLPSLSAMFERGQIKMPYFDNEETRNTVNTICGEFNSITFNQDKGTLESSLGHDDTAMSSFMAINDLRENNVEFKAYMV